MSKVKQNYTSSVLLKDRDYKMAQRCRFGDPRTFRKYLDMALANDLVIDQDDRYIFRPWISCIMKLFNLDYKVAKWIDKPFRKVITFKEHQYYIEQSLIGLNYKKQEHFIRRNFHQDKIQKGNTQMNIWLTEQLLKVAGKAKRASEANTKYNPSIVLKSKSKTKQTNSCDSKNNINGIVTGCIHLGNIIGRSTSTGNRRMKRLHSINASQSKDIVKYKDCIITDDAIDIMNEYKHNGALILPTNTGYKTIYGKKIISFNLGLFKGGCFPE